jgi:hypothetical protein
MMTSGLKSFLFGDFSIVTACSGKSRYGHTFGGPHDRRGTARADCNGIWIHLLHRLDLSDPAIPIAIPGVRWLPLYYCFDFRANDLGYRLTSDDTLVAFFPNDDPNVADEEEWPDDGYPLAFPKSNIAIAPYPYDPTKLDDAYTWVGVFGIGRLSKANQAAARERVAEEAAGLGFSAPETEEEFREALSSPFAQGRPDGKCLNPGCPNHDKKGMLTTIAMIPAEPVEGIHLFGRWGGGVQLIFQMCGRCHTIRVTNQSD